MSARDLARIALFAALTAALGLFPPLPVPLVPVPITAQSLGPMLAGLMLGARRGALAMLLLVVLVALGLPLLSGARGGLGVFFGPTAGFLCAWPFAAFVTGLLARRLPGVGGLIAAALVGGVGVLYAIGVPWLAAVAHLPLAKAALGSAAFLPGDALKAVLAGLLARSVRRAYPLGAERA